MTTEEVDGVRFYPLLVIHLGRTKRSQRRYSIDEEEAKGKKGGALQSV